jgi:glycoside/pentoside/hexuronide:cation symporter, GPH family
MAVRRTAEVEEPTPPSGSASSPVPNPAGRREPLPRSVVLALSCGYLGMSVLVNVINTILVFFYLPPDTAGLPHLVTDATILGVLNVVALVAAAGRFTDAITDPLIAAWSDRSTNPRGRRIPYMARGMVPAAVATILMFVPPVGSESGWNIAWLLVIQLVLYVSLTAYVTPAFALVADLGADPAERLHLSTWTSVAWAAGLLVGAQIFFIAPLLDGPLETVRAWQGSMAIVCTVALAFMVVPVLVIDEPRWARDAPASLPLLRSLRTVLGNPFFRFYAAADFAYFSGLAIIQTGVLFYVTVLLDLAEWYSSVLLILMVVVSVFLFPLVAGWARHQGGGKRLTIFAFLLASAVFLTISGLGVIDHVPFVQAAIPMAVFALPFAILSVMPQWILADIAEHAARTGGEAQAAMFYATRTFLQKLATTLGVVLFALLLQFGRDVGDDLGVRLTGLAGAGLYAVAAVLFARYDEDRLQGELAAAGQDSEFSPPS